MKDKDALRKVFLRARNQTPKSIHTDIQRRLVDFLLPKNFQHIALYYPIRNEIDVFSIIGILPQKSFYLPRVKGEKLEFSSTRGDNLVEGAFGIPEPKGDAFNPSLLDLIIVPGLAFTEDGIRLGYGGGFYDRFLEGVSGTFCLGVCPELLLVDSLPIEKHDRRMDLVLTESANYKSNWRQKMSAEAEFEELVDFLGLSFDASAGKMFGKRCIKIGKKAGIALFDGCLVFKLCGEAHQNAIDLDGSQLWDPSGKGRPMKEWVQITTEHRSMFEDFATSAANYVS